MKNKILALLLISSLIYSQNLKTPLFISGQDGYKSFRIPAIIKLPNNNLLAFCEGRVKGSADFGDINIVMKKSSDLGKTWGAIQTVVDYDSLQAGNCAPVVDLTNPNYPNGVIFLFYNTGNNHEGEVRKGNGLREVWYKISTDNGNTWLNETNITIQVHKPKQPLINKDYNYFEDWRSYAITPGHAIQLKEGLYKGRIFVAANHSVGGPRALFKDYFAHAFYTDDHGKTFKLSSSLNIAGSNESIAAELAGGKIMMNSRNQSGDVKYRIVSLSSNGANWDTTFFDYSLPDPVCQGSLLTVSHLPNKNILAFCNPADQNKRNNLTLRISYDDGATWQKSFLIDKDEESSNKDFTAYSDLVNLTEEEIGILYERDDYHQIIFTSINWKK